MAEQLDEQSRAVCLAQELGRCRQRGLDELDTMAHNKEPRATPVLDQLAADYCHATGSVVYGRVAEIRALVRDGLAAYAEQGNEPESQFIASLFFDASGASTQANAHGLLQAAQRESGIVDVKQFAEYRRARFTRFAGFLIAFIAQSLAVPVTQADPTTRAAQTAPEEPPASGAHGWRGQRRELVAAGAIGFVLFVTLIVGLTHPATSQPTQARTGAGTLRSNAAGSVSTALPGHTYIEMTGEFGAPTFTDPRHSAVTGVRIQPYETVQVACKVYAPTIPSASPDGYWYRIATAPWSGRYYAVANTFMNDDKIGAPAMHNTDFAVPDCSN